MRNLRVLLASALAPTVWGSTYAVTTQVLPPHRPLLDAVLRALPAGLALIAITARAAGRAVLPPAGWAWRAIVLGTLNIGLFFALLFVAADRLPGGVAAVVGALGPFVVSALAFPLLGHRPTSRMLLAALVGVAGVALLVLRSTVVLDRVGLAAALAAMVSMSVGTVLSRRWGLPPGLGSPVAALSALTGWQLTVGGMLLLPLALVREGLPGRLTAVNLIGFGYLTLIGTALAYLLWFRGVTRFAPVRMSLLSLLSPLVATAIGWLLLGQGMSAGQVLGAGAVLLAVVLGVTGPSPIAAPPAVAHPGAAPAVAAPSVAVSAGSEPAGGEDAALRGRVAV